MFTVVVAIALFTIIVVLERYATPLGGGNRLFDKVLARVVGRNVLIESAPPIEPGSGLPWIVMIFLAAVAFVDSADLAMLPATYRVLEEEFGLSPMWIGVVSLAQALALKFSSPVWGWLVDEGASRKHLMALGSLGWGGAVLMLAFARSFGMVLFLRAVNGVFLACLNPLAQSLIADALPESRLGKAFGMFSLFGAAGSVCMSPLTLLLSHRVFFGWLAGWRLCFASVGVVSLFLSVATYLLMPQVGRAVPASGGFNASEGPKAAIANIWRNLAEHWRIGTFRVIILQGVFGSVPWWALGFFPIWAQYAGLTDDKIAIVSLVQMLAGGLGPFIGGALADALSHASPRHGRALTAQLSIVLGIIPVTLLLFVVPAAFGTMSVWPYVTLVALFGLTATWCGAGVNRPILSQIVRPSARASIIAWDIALEGAVGAIFGGPFVGFLAQHFFLYVPSRLPVSEMSHAFRLQNAMALRNALYMMTLGPWIVCACAYTLLHWTYPRDIAMIRQGAADKERMVVEPVAAGGSALTENTLLLTKQQV